MRLSLQVGLQHSSNLYHQCQLASRCPGVPSVEVYLRILHGFAIPKVTKVLFHGPCTTRSKILLLKGKERLAFVLWKILQTQALKWEKNLKKVQDFINEDAFKAGGCLNSE